MFKNFPEYNDRLQETMGLFGVDCPDLMSGFVILHKAAMMPGTLSIKFKELIALAIAITVRCDGCVALHVHDALDAGASKEEILEAVGVAILMGGGPSLVYGVEALEAINQFRETDLFKELY
ncbi:MAG: carboxymuconolactone decarboxylase family protein [Candidatus Zixiibacteriota bacterium]